MVNDLSRETCPAQQVKCVVIDEAHKALGNHAYCQVKRSVVYRRTPLRFPSQRRASEELITSYTVLGHHSLKKKRREKYTNLLTHVLKL